MRSVLSIEIPQYSRWGLYPQSVFIVCCYAWWVLCQTPPGLAIAALALAAVVMTVRAEHFTKTERVVWVIIAFLLFGAEGKSIYQDHMNAENVRREELRRQQAQFDQTIRDLKALVGQNQTHFEKTMGKVDDVINTETGGDTFCSLLSGYKSNRISWLLFS